LNYDGPTASFEPYFRHRELSVGQLSVDNPAASNQAYKNRGGGKFRYETARGPWDFPAATVTAITIR